MAESMYSLDFFNNIAQNNPYMGNITGEDLLKGYQEGLFTGISGSQFEGGSLGGKDLSALGSQSDNILGLSGLSNMDVLKGGLGIGQLGLGILGYLDNKKTAGLQRDLMGQQKEQNRFLIDQAKGRAKDIKGAFGAPSGLAASAATPKL